ncbi:MAG: hypothetical protein MUE85_01680 [Microscillaceae bacterium]|jgi:hypothetical protein|nr:hypothetical protein [Microscillaceae bacterium]
MKFFRKNIIFRILCFVVIFQLLNFSIDAPDAQPDYLPENLAINDIESIVELVLEDFLGLEDAISEQDEPDEDNNSPLNKKTEFLHQKDLFQSFVIVSYNSKPIGRIYKSNHYLFDFTKEIIQPPEV